MPDNVLAFEALARAVLSEEAFAYLAGGADDERTLNRNANAFADVSIRCRRLVDVSTIDLTTNLLGETLPSPIILSSVGVQGIFHPEGELETARAAATRGHRFMAATLSHHHVGEVAKAGGTPPWFQLYPTTDRKVTAGLIEQAEKVGCPVLVLTVDVPAIGNREAQQAFLDHTMPTIAFGNLDPFGGYTSFADPSMTWDIVSFIREHTNMKLLLKGIVTHEDAKLSVEHGVDGVIVSNHGGRQEESDRATIECLPEVVEAIDGKMPVLLDSGIRRGTDVFKALAMGASAVAIGRPYIWGLAAEGQSGVEQVLNILDRELEHTMKLAGVISIEGITSEYVV